MRKAGASAEEFPLVAAYWQYALKPLDGGSCLIGAAPRANSGRQKNAGFNEKKKTRSPSPS
jgi:hypothetical protein